MVPVQEIILSKLPIQIYIILCLISIDAEDIARLYEKEVEPISIELWKKMIEDGWVIFLDLDEGSEISLETIYPSRKFFNFINGNDPKNWMDEWMDLWPSGVKSGSYYVKTDKNGCIRKMRKFNRIYPQYSKKLIMDATKEYITRLKYGDYKYMKIAPYFIEKDGISVLAGECDALLNKMTENDKNEIMEDRFGETEFS